MQPRQISVPKAFFVGERDKFYSNWIEAFPREFVQNSVDAGARNIAIRIEGAPAKGSFGKEPGRDTVTRVTFEDDGTGMSRQVLEDVFFALGESTKRGDEGQTGGFGRARIMQAFSQVRYAIRTRDCVVEGDGCDFDVVTVDEGRRTHEGWSAELDAAADAELGDWRRRDRMREAARLHREEADRLAQEGPALKGCRFEVDLDPDEGDYYAKRPTADRVREAFEAYFRLSDVKCRVTINGQEVAHPSRRMETHKKLVATMKEGDIPPAGRKCEILDRADGRKDVVFATLHGIRESGMREGEKGKMNVRVRGASMFVESAHSDDHALVLELVPALARDVLTSNRDGMRSPYKQAVEQLTREMATDANKALDARKDEELVLLRGGKGRRTRTRPATDFSVKAPELPQDAGEEIQSLSKAANGGGRHVEYGRWSWQATTEKGLDGVPFEEIKEFMAVVADAKAETFLDAYADTSAVATFKINLQRSGEHAAMVEAPGELLGHIVDNLRYRKALAERKKAEAYKEKMGGLNDVVILRKDVTPQADRFTEAEQKSRRAALMQASRRFDPRNWDQVTGKGKAPHQTLAAWTVMVDHAVDLLLKTQPQQKAFPYATGWTFSHKKWEHIAARHEYGWQNAGARYMRPNAKDELRYFLLNPLEDEAFRLAYDHKDPASMARMWAMAVHEVAHVASEDHNTAFAYVMTQMLQAATPDFMQAMYKEVDGKAKAVSALYGKGRTRSAAMDSEPGERPIQRLLAGIAPDASLEAGPDGGLDLDAGEAARLLSEAFEAGPEPDLEDDHAPRM